MASFTAFLDVGGRAYPLYRYELAMHQETDTLGRPASPVLGGRITCMLSSPGNRDPFLYQWMLSPTAQYDGKIRLMQAGLNATEKTISFFNAYCTQFDIHFSPGQRGGIGSSWIQLQISPQRIAVGAIIHDNNWPLASHGAGEQYEQSITIKKQGPSYNAVHTALDLMDTVPVLNQISIPLNELLYQAEGDPMLGQDMSSRPGACVGTEKFPYGTVGYNVHASIGAIQLFFRLKNGSPGYGEAAIGNLFNRPDVQELLAMKDTPENNLKVAKLEYEYWQTIYNDPNQTLPNQEGAWYGSHVPPATRVFLQEKLGALAHQRDEGVAAMREAVMQLKEGAQKRLEQLRQTFSLPGN